VEGQAVGYRDVRHLWQQVCVGLAAPGAVQDGAARRADAALAGLPRQRQRQPVRGRRDRPGRRRGGRTAAGPAGRDARRRGVKGGERGWERGRVGIGASAVTDRDDGDYYEMDSAYPPMRARQRGYLE
jgi:hypothetical protein